MSTKTHGMMSVQTGDNKVKTMDTQCTNMATEEPVGNTTASTSGTETSSSSDAGASSDVTSDLDLLLIGKSGVGKSATGNSILGKKAFKSSASLNSETDKVSCDVAKVSGRVIKVVDGPGVGDTRMDTEEGIRLFVDSMEHAMFTNPQGYHAFLLVLRFGTRFTQEDSDTIALLKKVFGSDFVKNYCILLMTCGDMFKYEAEENEVDFPQWVNQQTGQMAELVKECQGRIVLFDNTTKNQEKKSAQLDELLKGISSLNNNGKRYTDANFQSAMESREKVIVESTVPIARDETIRDITLLMQELGEIRVRGSESKDIASSEATVQDFKRLLKSAERVKQDVTEQDKNTGALMDLVQSIETIERSIKSSLELYQGALESRRQQQISETEISSHMRELEEQMKSAKAEQQVRELKEQNEILALRLKKMELEKEEVQFRQEEMQRKLMVDYGNCEKDLQMYRQRREVNIFIKMKNFGGKIVKKIINLFMPKDTW